MGEEDVKLVLPWRHARAHVGPDRAPRQEERRRHDVELPALLARDGKGLRHVGPLHEAEMQREAHELVAHRLHLHPVVDLHARNVFVDDGQDHVVLVQHLVVLEIVQQRRRREIRVGGEEHGGPRHDIGRPLLEVLDQRLERHLDAPRFLGEQPRAAPPRRHDDHQHQADEHRQPCALDQLERACQHERGVDEDKGRHQRDRPDELPAPQLPQHDEAEYPRGPFRGGHGKHIGASKFVRGAEHEHEQEDADEEQPIDPRHVDLPRLRLGGVAHLHAGQEAELHGLARDGVGAGDDGLAGDRRGHGGERHHGIERPLRKQQIERIGDGVRLEQHERALAEIVEQQRRQHEEQPGGLDRPSPEMAEIVVERLRARHDEEHRAERDEPDNAVREQEVEPVIGI